MAKAEEMHDELFTMNVKKDFDAKKAKDAFRKMTQKTSYRQQFGEPPKAEEDYVVVKHNAFRSLDIARYIQPEPAQYIERWI